MISKNSEPMFFAARLRGFGLAGNCDSHGMPIGLGEGIGSVASLMLPPFFVANGISVPISRGRPPGLLVQA